MGHQIASEDGLGTAIVIAVDVEDYQTNTPNRTRPNLRPDLRPATGALKPKTTSDNFISPSFKAMGLAASKGHPLDAASPASF
jgi:hypothetical protein